MSLNVSESKFDLSTASSATDALTLKAVDALFERLFPPATDNGASVIDTLPRIAQLRG